MALEDCVEISRTGAVDNQGHRTYVRNFLVTTTSKQDGPYLVMTAPGIVWGDSYNLGGSEIDLYAYARDFQSRLHDETNSKQLWVVTVTYTSKPEPGQYISGGGLTQPSGSTNPPTPQANESPPDRAWSVSWGSTKVKTVAYRDLGTGKKVRSSNGLKYGTPLEGEHVVKTITITSWQDPSTYDVYAAQSAYINTCNDDVWEGFDAGVLKCEDLTGELMWEQGAWWLKVTLVIHVAAGTMLCYQAYPGDADLGTPEISWDTEVMNTGLRELVGTELRTIYDKFNKPITEPFPLAADGQKLTIPAAPTDPSYTYKRFRLHPWADWTSII